MIIEPFLANAIIALAMCCVVAGLSLVLVLLLGWFCERTNNHVKNHKLGMLLIWYWWHVIKGIPNEQIKQFKIVAEQMGYVDRCEIEHLQSQVEHLERRALDAEEALARLQSRDSEQ